MGKAKTKAQIMVPDGAGGMTQVQDRRFEQANWPIRFEVPKEQADDWLLYLSAECGKRKWSCGGMSQVDGKENSGSLTISMGPGEPPVALIWERRRGGPLKVCARPATATKAATDQVEELFRDVNVRSQAGDKQRIYRRGHLCFEGLPWAGELWLNDSIRLGPPSRQDGTALLGPRIIIVDAWVDAIDIPHASSVFAVLLREVSVFLSVVLGCEVRVDSNGRRDWTWASDDNGKVQCDVRSLGYWEKEWPAAMPERGQAASVPLKTIVRPDTSQHGIDGSEAEIHLPSDILHLWQQLANLSVDRRRQFLQAGSMWQLALSLSHVWQTARFALMVAACEALKRSEAEYDDHNVYHVVEALLGKGSAESLRRQSLRPQDVRSSHLHRGELFGLELVPRMMMPSFYDPTFDVACREMWRVTQSCIIEWLLRGGEFSMPVVVRRKSWRRWVKENTLVLLAAVAVIAAGAGGSIGWFAAWWAYR